jgi:hypothetical protein
MGTVPAPDIVRAASEISQNPLTEYARATSLQQNADLFEQQKQQNAQQLESQRRALADQDATTQAFLKWDHKDPNELATSVVKNGGSATAAQAIQQHYLGLRKTASDIAKQDAETGGSVLKTKIDQYNQDAGRLSALDSVPDEELPQHLTDEGQKLSASQDPQEQQSGQHILQLANLPPAQARQQLKVIEHALLGEKEQHEQAMKESEVATKALEAKTTATRLQAEMPGGPMEAPDKAELRSYLKDPRVPGEMLAPSQRTPASFLVWKAKQSPMAVVLGNQLGAKGEGSALDQAAERYSKDGSLPSGFGRSPGTVAAIIKRSAELHPDQDLASNKATFQADTAALKQVQKQFDTMNAFEGTALKNLKLYADTAKKIPDLGARFANIPLRMITGHMIGTDNMAALNAARQTASSEVAKVLSSATGSGVLSDSQKKEAQDVIDGNLPLSATLKVVETLEQDMANRHQSYQEDINAIRGRLGAKPQTSPQGDGGSASTTGSTVPKSLTAAQITAYAQAHGVSEAEVKRQAKAKGIQVP